MTFPELIIAKHKTLNSRYTRSRASLEDRFSSFPSANSKAFPGDLTDDLHLIVLAGMLPGVLESLRFFATFGDCYLIRYLRPVDDFKGQARRLKVYGDYFWDFYTKQTRKAKERILWTIRLIRDIQRVPEKYLKHLEGTDSMYEIRVSSGNNIFRIFCFFDEGQLVILLNAFQKKTQKTPTNEIEKTKKLKKQYYEDKKNQSR